MNKLRKKFGKRTKYNYKRTFFGLFLFLLVLGIGIVYATLTTNLSINGTSHVKSSRWDVHFENVQITAESVIATVEPTIVDDTTVNFGVTFEKPGDVYEFTIDIVNDGSLDAIINGINISPKLTIDQQNYFSYVVEYNDGYQIQPGDLLNVGDTQKIKIRFEYLETDDDLYPLEDDYFDFSITVECAQDQSDDSFEDINGIKYTYNLENPHKPSDNVIVLNQKVPKGVKLFDSAQEARYGLLYLKHDIENSIVKESRVCFVYESNTYCLRGGVNETALSEKPIYEENKAIMQSIFPSNRCSDGSSNYRCNMPLIQVQINDNGNDYAIDGYGLCSVDSMSKAFCLSIW